MVLCLVLQGGPSRASDERPPVRVRAPRPSEPAEDPSSFASAIDLEERRGEALDAPALLSREVGVQVRRFGGPGEPAEISVRGSTGRQVAVLFDGVRLNSVQTGSLDLSTVPVGFLERLQVARGAGAVRAGGGAAGGVIELVPRRAEDEPRTELSLAGGSFGLWEGSLFHAQRIEDDREVAIAYQGFATEGDFDFQTAEVRSDVAAVPSSEEKRINNDAERHAATLRLARRLDDRFELSFSDQALYLARGQPGLDRRQDADAREYRTRNLASARLRGEALGGDGAWGVDAGLYHRFERVRFRDPDPPPPLQPTNQRDLSHVGGGRAALEWRGGDHLEHRVLAMGDLRRELLDSRQFGDRRRWVTGIALEDELAVWQRRITLIPGVRLDYTEGFGSEWLPRIGAILEPWPGLGLRVKANLERTYRAPGFDELYFDFGSIRGNPNLKPERSDQWDAGLEWTLRDRGIVHAARLEVVWFESDIENSIVFQQVSPTTVAATNTGDARVRGLEVSAAVDLWGWLALSANYTYQDARRKSDDFGAQLGAGGDALPGRAEDELSLRLRVGPSDLLWKLVVERHHVSEIPLTESGLAEVAGRTTWDVTAALDVARWWPEQWPLRPRSTLLSAALINAGDESVRDALGFPQPGRTLQLRAELRW